MANNKKSLKSWEIAFMVIVALFFDAIQWLLAFILMDWIVSIYAFLTFYIWFKIKGMSFMRPKRILTMGGSLIVELVPILSTLPTWTFAVVVLVADMKAKEVLSSPTETIDLNKEREKRRGGDEMKKAA